MQCKLIFMDTYCSFVKKTSLSDRCICDHSKMDGCSFIYSVLKIKPVASSGMAVRFDVRHPNTVKNNLIIYCVCLHKILTTWKVTRVIQFMDKPAYVRIWKFIFEIQILIFSRISGKSICTESHSGFSLLCLAFWCANWTVRVVTNTVMQQA